MSQPHGWSTWDNGKILSGWDRPFWRIENEEEILLAFHNRRKPTLMCAYCGRRQRSESVKAAVRWFHAHDCDQLELAEAQAMIVDLTPLAKAA